MFYGDSITELWRGTEFNSSHARQGPEIKRVYEAHFSRFRSIVLAIAGEHGDVQASG